MLRMLRAPTAPAYELPPGGAHSAKGHFGATHRPQDDDHLQADVDRWLCERGAEDDPPRLVLERAVELHAGSERKRHRPSVSHIMLTGHLVM